MFCILVSVNSSPAAQVHFDSRVQDSKIRLPFDYQIEHIAHGDSKLDYKPAGREEKFHQKRAGIWRGCAPCRPL
jgi:hypothetical protein